MFNFRFLIQRCEKTYFYRGQVRSDLQKKIIIKDLQDFLLPLICSKQNFKLNLPASCFERQFSGFFSIELDISENLSFFLHLSLSQYSRTSIVITLLRKYSEDAGPGLQCGQRG